MLHLWFNFPVVLLQGGKTNIRNKGPVNGSIPVGRPALPASPVRQRERSVTRNAGARAPEEKPFGRGGKKGEGLNPGEANPSVCAALGNVSQHGRVAGAHTDPTRHPTRLLGGLGRRAPPETEKPPQGLRAERMELFICKGQEKEGDGKGKGNRSYLLLRDVKLISLQNHVTVFPDFPKNAFPAEFPHPADLLWLRRLLVSILVPLTQREREENGRKNGIILHFTLLSPLPLPPTLPPSPGPSRRRHRGVRFSPQRFSAADMRQQQ